MIVQGAALVGVVTAKQAIYNVNYLRVWTVLNAPKIFHHVYLCCKKM